MSSSEASERRGATGLGEEHHIIGGRQFGAADFVLAALTLPALLIALMFATTGMMRLFERRSARRKFMALLLVCELAIAAFAIAAMR